jgi:hypothetical protein
MGRIRLPKNGYLNAVRISNVFLIAMVPFIMSEDHIKGLATRYLQSIIR